MRFVNGLAASLAGIAAALVFGLAGQVHAEAPADAPVTADGGAAHVRVTTDDSGWQ
ncbi:hypothetical protein [Streptomyces sp. NPDC093260]|uniref:hypothetical protein n=1 Tax=Streptomyces sp. NPDC093260 TaxID=3155073 RepID=UPI0034333A8B